MSFEVLCIIGMLFGVGLGYCVQRAGLCFAHGLGEIFAGKGRRILRFFCIIFIITSTGFVLSGLIDPKLGLQPVGLIRGAGFFNIVSGVLFGAGILLNGGCILGTMRQLGEGNLLYLVILLSFIPGMALVVYGIDPVLKPFYKPEQTLLPGLIPVHDYLICGVLVLACIVGLLILSRKKKMSLPA